MDLISATWKMVRPVNLAIILITQMLVRYLVIYPVIADAGGNLAFSIAGFALLVFSTVMIAAAGYIINDILDEDIDQINRPGRTEVTRSLSAHTRDMIYYGFNAVGILAGILAAGLTGKIELGIIFLIVATVLYYYSLKYKYLTFWGNFTVSLLSAFTIIIVWLFEFFAFRNTPGSFMEAFAGFPQVSLFVWGYALFAFLTTMSREITKDLEDKEGDAANGCRTIPVRYGSNAGIWTVVTLDGIILLLLAGAQWLTWSHNYQVLAAGLSVPVVLTIIHIYRTLKASDSDHHRANSRLMKVLMLAGILTMLLVTFRSF